MNLEKTLHSFHNTQHFSFDLWKTLIRSNKEFKRLRPLLIKDFYSIDCADDEISKVTRKYDVLCDYASKNTGLHVNAQLIVSYILLELGKPIEQEFLANWDDFYTSLEELFLEFPPILLHDTTYALFSDIKEEGKSLSLLSNTGFIEGKSVNAFLKQIELFSYFDFLIYSDEEGISKPNPKIFEKVYQETLKIKNIEKNQITHIGDDEFADIRGAANYGFNTFLAYV